MAQDFNQIVQWDILFHRKIMVSHLLDETIGWTVGEMMASKSAIDLVECIMTG